MPLEKRKDFAQLVAAEGAFELAYDDRVEVSVRVGDRFEKCCGLLAVSEGDTA